MQNLAPQELTFFRCLVTALKSRLKQVPLRKWPQTILVTIPQTLQALLGTRDPAAQSANWRLLDVSRLLWDLLPSSVNGEHDSAQFIGLLGRGFLYSAIDWLASDSGFF